MKSSSCSSLLVVLALISCKDPTLGSQESGSAAPAAPPSPEQLLEELIARPLQYELPQAEISQLPLPPTELPAAVADAPPTPDHGPHGHRADFSPVCIAIPHLAGACMHVVESPSGEVLEKNRYEYRDGHPTLLAQYEPPAVLRSVESCTRDGAGRIVQRRIQRCETQGDDGCGRWRLVTKTSSYDARGYMVSLEDRLEKQAASAERRDLGVDLDVWALHFAEDQLERVEHFEGTQLSDLEFSDIELYRWASGELVGIDTYWSGGEWEQSLALTHEANLWRIDRVVGQQGGELERAERVYERTGEHTYRKVYVAGPKLTRFEYVEHEGKLTTSKLVDGVLVGRKVSQLHEDGERTLTVEELNDQGALSLVESWDWQLPERVVLTRPTQRETFLMDCEGEPKIEETWGSFAPPLPIR